MENTHYNQEQFKKGQTVDVIQGAISLIEMCILNYLKYSKGELSIVDLNMSMIKLQLVKDKLLGVAREFQQVGVC